MNHTNGKNSAHFHTDSSQTHSVVNFRNCETQTAEFQHQKVMEGGHLGCCRNRAYLTGVRYSKLSTPKNSALCLVNILGQL